MWIHAQLCDAWLPVGHCREKKDGWNHVMTDVASVEMLTHNVACLFLERETYWFLMKYLWIWLIDHCDPTLSTCLRKVKYHEFIKLPWFPQCASLVYWLNCYGTLTVFRSGLVQENLGTELGLRLVEKWWLFLFIFCTKHILKLKAVNLVKIKDRNTTYMSSILWHVL